MKTLVTRAIRFLISADGPTAVEYAVMLALIVFVCASAIALIGGTTGGSFDHSSSQIQAFFGD
jgi:pilus assembly protein Flp/PilA